MRVCSFCNKTEDDVEKLIVANVGWYENLAICNECIGLASDLIEEDDEEHEELLLEEGGNGDDNKLAKEKGDSDHHISFTKQKKKKRRARKPPPNTKVFGTWWELISENGKPYYYNKKTRETRWSLECTHFHELTEQQSILTAAGMGQKQG